MMLPSAKATTTICEAIGLLARLDPLQHVGLGHVDQLIGQALEPVGERPRLASLTSRAAAMSPARAFDRPGHDRDEAVVVVADLGQQVDLVLGHVLEAGRGRSRTG